MTLRKSLLLLITLSAIAASVGCSSSSSAPPAPVAVVLTAVGSPLTVNSITPVTATVTGDTANAGVTWSCTPTPGCGSFSSTASGSGVPVDYVAPAIPPSTTVVIIATSVTSPTTSADSQAITIGNASLADGTYVFNLAGTDTTNDSPYYVSGAFVVSAGAITSGEQDFADFNTATSDSINPVGSAVATGADGLLTITLVTCNALDCTGIDPFVGVSGIETLSGSLVPFPTGATTALISEFDASASASGELDLQTSQAAPAGGYAFEVGGIDSSFSFLAIGGILNVDGAGTISGTNSIFDVNDGGSGTTFQGQLLSASTVSAVDGFGRFTFNLVPTANFNPITLIGYTIDGNRIRLVEEPSDSFGGTTGGIAYSQASALVNTFTAAANFNGNTYVIGETGADVDYYLQVVSLLTPSASGDGSVAGFLDSNDGSGSQAVSPDPVTAPAASTTVDLTGRVTIVGLTDSNITTPITTTQQIYLDGNGHALAISMDTVTALNGVGYQQASSDVGNFTAAALNNGYALGVTGWDFNFDEIDAVGPVDADGTGTITGFADVNWQFSTGCAIGATTGLPTCPDAPVTGTFVASSNGIFSGTITGLDVSTCVLYNALNAGCTSDVFSYYLVDQLGDGFVIETDFGATPTQLTMGRIAGQQ